MSRDGGEQQRQSSDSQQQQQQQADRYRDSTTSTLRLVIINTERHTLDWIYIWWQSFSIFLLIILI
jgi:hypothetical protein